MGVETSVWGEIQGQAITFPMEVPDLDAATLLFTVPADAAQRLLPGDDFEVIAAPSLSGVADGSGGLRIGPRGVAVLRVAPAAVTD